MSDDPALAGEQKGDEEDRERYLMMKRWQHPTAIQLRPRDIDCFPQGNWSRGKFPDAFAQRNIVYQGIRRKLRYEPTALTLTAKSLLTQHN